MPIYYEAIAPCEAFGEEELSFPMGAILEMIKSDDKNGWHKMKYQDRVGMVHASNIKTTKLTPDQQQQQPQQQPQQPQPGLPPRRQSAFDRMRSADTLQKPVKGKNVIKENPRRPSQPFLSMEDDNTNVEEPTSIDPAVLETGVYYHVQFLGTVDAVRPFRELKPDDRPLVLLEAINICAERSGIKPALKLPGKRSVPDTVKDTLGVVYVVKKKGCAGMSQDVELLVDLDTVTLTMKKDMSMLDSFSIGDIALLSGGSSWFPKCIAFVVRSSAGRLIYVFYAGKYANSVVLALSEALKQRHLSKASKAGGGAVPI